MTQVNVQFVAKSSNSKTGPIPVTTSGRDTCPPTCPLIKNGCYAHTGYYTRMNWDKVTSGERGGDWQALCDSIAALPAGTTWRHNVAGDLPHNDGTIDYPAVKQLVDSNKGRHGFTYTHHKITRVKNREAIETANMKGFTVNLSADNPAMADELAALDIGPVVAIVPADQMTNCKTPAGRDIAICPAVIKENVSCATCKLCASTTRKVIVGFPAHGAQKSKINI